MTLAALTPDRLRRFVEGAAAVAGQTDLQALLATAVETAMELTGARYGALGVIGEDGSLVEFMHSGMDPALAADIGAPPQGVGVLGTISRGGATIRVEHVSEHPEAVGFPAHHPHMESFLGVPVRAGTELFGNLYLTDNDGGFSDEDEALTEALAIIVGAAVRTLRLQVRLRRLAVVEDRERIARDLHDAIIQNLFAVGLSLQAQSQKVADPDIKSALESNVDNLDATISSLRQFIFQLNQPAIERRSLPTEVRELIARLGSPHDVDVHVEYYGQFEDLPERVIDDALQLVRESVSNALRHSGSTRVNVRLHGEDESLSIVVEDEGVGFDPETATWGLGLANLRSRTARAGGEVEIVSAPESGTTVRAVLPR